MKRLFRITRKVVDLLPSGGETGEGVWDAPDGPETRWDASVGWLVADGFMRA